MFSSGRLQRSSTIPEAASVLNLAEGEGFELEAFSGHEVVVEHARNARLIGESQMTDPSILERPARQANKSA